MKYNRALDMLLAAVTFTQQGKLEKAAKFLSVAAKHKDIKAVIAALDKHQEKSLAALRSEVAAAKAKPKSSVLAQYLAEVAAKKKAKAAPKKKKKAKAASEVAEGDDFDMTLDDMTEEDANDELMDDSLDDLTLDDLDDGAEEMPLASDEPSLDGEGVTDDFLEEDEDVVVSEAEDDEKDTDEDEDDEDESEEEPKEESKTTASTKAKSVNRVQSNMQALARLQKTVSRK
jgi:hypothetical protein